MKNYFQLQYKMLNRHLIDFGISPLLAYVILLIGFVYGSNQWFIKFEFASYVHAFVGLSVVSKASNKNRNDFLKLSFPSTTYISIRIIENILLVFPFVLFLVYKQVFFSGFILGGLAIVLSFINLNFNTSFTIPTPFKKQPFEFIEGFRKTFFVFLFAYILVGIGVKVGNFNLAIFSLLLVFGVCLSYFSKMEKPYYAWLFTLTTKDFLYYKIKTAFKYVFWLSLPISITTSLFFPSKIIIIIAFNLIGYVYLAQFILAKYSVFPNQMSLPTAIVFLLSILFPPFVFVAFWYFHKEAIKKLNTVLDD